MPNGTEALQREKVKPIPSHRPEPRTTGAVIGPSNTVQSEILNPVRPDYRGEGDPTSWAELSQKLGDTPVGNILLSYATSGVPGAGSSSGVMPAVTGYLPSELPEMRAAGFNRIMRAAKEGLERRVFGYPSTDTPKSNIPLNDRTIQILRIMQERWPRVFAHVQDLSDTDVLQKLRGIGSGTSILGASGPLPQRLASQIPSHWKADKLSTYRLSPEAIDRRMLAGHTEEESLINTVGHELLHVADRIRLGGKMQPAYELANRSGRAGNIFEQRAEAFGKRFEDIVEATERAGGGRSFLGKNPRVPTNTLKRNP